MPAIFGYGALTSVLITAYEYTGASLRGKNPWANEDDGLDEFERREQTRKPKRRPIEQTIAEIGEGRGELSCFSGSCSLRCFQKLRTTTRTSHTDSCRHRAPGFQRTKKGEARGKVRRQNRACVGRRRVNWGTGSIVYIIFRVFARNGVVNDTIDLLASIPARPATGASR